MRLPGRLPPVGWHYLPAGHSIFKIHQISKDIYSL